jgi:hypothetical protein
MEATGLRAVGLPGAPITFSALNQKPGGWCGLWIMGDSRLDGVVI